MHHRNLKLILSYDGTGYLGWQQTKMGPSIEETLANALQKVLQRPVALQAASRTDAGVHAEGQVVNFCTDSGVELAQLAKSLNGVLPQEIRISSIAEAAQDFHPTLDCTGKEYVYQICNSPFQLPFHRHLSWHFSMPLDPLLMRKGAEYLIGTHDFSAFCNEQSLSTRIPICTIACIGIEELPNSRIRITIRGDRFLYKMVRNLVGTLAYIGCGKLGVDELSEILNGRDRTRAGVTAPAHGLSLKQVFYVTAQ